MKMIFTLLLGLTFSSCALLENCQNYSEETERNACVARHENDFLFGGGGNQAGVDAMNATNAAGAAGSNHIHHHTPPSFMGGAGVMPGM